ncbi:MAG TPA: class I tRNA ligase family protein, partial [Thermoanaerobaculia bacterium]|nr:class I tRNA ligase family protein [Thermoanaerobaculia bacterium]
LEEGRKMSKSAGTGVSPQDVIKQHGADILRLWVSMVDYRDDMTFGNEILIKIGDGYRKIRNTARFLLANLYDFDPSRDMVPSSELQPIDVWLLSEAADVFERARKAYDDFEFHFVYHRVLEFCTVQLSAVYASIMKDALYVEGSSSSVRRSSQTAMYRVLDGLVRIIAPILSFTADEIYEAMPGSREGSVHLTQFPEDAPERLTAQQREAWDRLFRLRESVSKVLEGARGVGQIGQSLEADIVLSGGFDMKQLLGGLGVDLAQLFIVSHVEHRSAAVVGDKITFDGIGEVGITMTPASGVKCARCWQYRDEVTPEQEICHRCSALVA